MLRKLNRVVRRLGRVLRRLSLSTFRNTTDSNSSWRMKSCFFSKCSVSPWPDILWWDNKTILHLQYSPLDKSTNANHRGHAKPFQLRITWHQGLRERALATKKGDGVEVSKTPIFESQFTTFKVDSPHICRSLLPPTWSKDYTEEQNQQCAKFH